MAAYFTEMNEPPRDGLELDMHRIARSVRFALASVVLGFSYVNVKLAFSIGTFEAIYHDMLNGKPLPWETLLLLKLKWLIVALSVALPVLAVVSLRMKNLGSAIYLVGWLVPIVFIYLFTTWNFLMAPLITIIQTMQGG